ncbi:MAG TPA: hypothetical protein VHU77_10260 [Candidatus Limnocylindria bacterium]|nr:hypothetical protein [Candidatus Limnocylindria bacterium]
MEEVRAIGRIRPDGPWVGFGWRTDGPRLAVGDGSTIREGPAQRDVLLALAIAYFEEAFENPPQDMEASHEDLSSLVRDVASGEESSERRRLLSEAIDAIDDGLAGDAVANSLAAARGAEMNEQADPVDLLVTLTEELLRD